jgi:uncharacterized protein (TIGR03435 family)
VLRSSSIAAQQDAFDVASVKPANCDILQHRGLGCTFPSRERVNCLGWVRYLIAVAYDIPAARLQQDVAGGPKWIDDDLFEIQALIRPEDRPALTTERGLAMLRTLLADRFKLAVHRERKEIPSYALVIASKDRRLGPQLKPTPQKCSDWIAGGRQGAPPDVFSDVPCGRGLMNAGTMRQTRVPLSQLANLLSGSPSIQRPVEDRTALTGMYAFELRWAPEARVSPASDGLPPVPPSENVPASIFTALQEQLGLKLEPTRMMADLLVIDHIERQTPD